MTTLTPNQDFPYPDPADALIGVDDAIKALALALDGTPYTNLALAAGWTAGGGSGVRYAKAGGVVTVAVNVIKASWAAGEDICSVVLPAAFRPNMITPGFGTNATVDNAPRGFEVLANGTIQAGAAGTGSIYGVLTYVGI